VKEVKADHDADNVTIEYDEASVQPEQMKEAVDDLGRFEMIL
jgi:copper chaperone CopZ